MDFFLAYMKILLYFCARLYEMVSVYRYVHISLYCRIILKTTY